MNIGANQEKIKNELVEYLQSRLKLNQEELAHFKKEYIPFLHDIVAKWIDALNQITSSFRVSQTYINKSKLLEKELHQQTIIQQEQKKQILEIQSLATKYKNNNRQLKERFAVMMQGYYQNQAIVEGELANHVCSFYEAVEKQANKKFLLDEPQAQPAYSLRNIYQLEVIPPVREVLAEASELSLMFAKYFITTNEYRQQFIRRCKWDLADQEEKDPIISEFIRITSTTEQSDNLLLQSHKEKFAKSNIFVGQMI